MYLCEVDICGFKGIKQLTLSLNKDANVLIGENQWGRSSLISALMLISLDNFYYQFTANDFFNDDHYQPNTATIRYKFAEMNPQELDSQSYHSLNCVAYQSVEFKKLITYQIKATKEQDKIVTEHQFLDNNGKEIKNVDHYSLIKQLISLNPCMRLKNPVDSSNLPVTNQPLSDYYIQQLSAKLSEHAKQFSNEDLIKSLTTAKALFEYYLADSSTRFRYRNSNIKTIPNSQDWDSLERLNNILDELDDNYIRTMLMGIFGSIFIAHNANQIHPNAIPILVMEEPESQLHPIILSVGFRLLKNFPAQKFITTNSSDLLSLFALKNIYHLIRKPSGIMAMNIGEKGLSRDDNRKIMFHILYRRASAMFARCWLLVEGETEVWLLRELAELSGFHLNAEGIQLIEFAQCGLKPLIRYANKMGIHWYVLTDGDTAGKKYANTVRSLCPEGTSADQFLTVLPSRDIENFMFEHGFSHVYKKIAFNTTDYIDIPVNRIVHKAIKKTSKPDLAIAICDDVRIRGSQTIPKLLKQTFSKVMQLTKQFY
ncbi:putative ATP-dependent endonuclease of OLD family [Frischella perrara]|uniref:Putative ATP-dependent endonuclease of the OLD family n=1 Tax=Frischella perrara TaxID=1267021 RepID=A0A0A7RYE9_FRIPE|nr:DUF2813 domain-containing protein [Frischella perrara]AJA44335.1 putative ATP-dependent endonuclease of the OLD family [Frischella perrara]PWV64021.1 putative ATP-dependent endonuclease of OLD family [Frischella perrara]